MITYTKVGKWKNRPTKVDVGQSCKEIRGNDRKLEFFIVVLRSYKEQLGKLGRPRNRRIHTVIPTFKGENV